MNQVKIGIIEDEIIIAENISICLRSFGYEVAPIAQNFNHALKMIKEEMPDLLLIDINLGGEKDGIDIAHFIREKYSIPIIFLTANVDLDTILRAKTANPNAFLVKPFSKDNLFASIEIAVSNYHSKAKLSRKSMMVKDGYVFIQVLFEKILFISSERNYVTLHMDNHRKIIVRSTVLEMMEHLDENDFLRINRSIILNINYVSRIETRSVHIEDKIFSIAKLQRDQLVSLLESKMEITK